MKTTRVVIGLFVLIFSIILTINFAIEFIMMTATTSTSKYLAFSVIGILLGIVIMFSGKKDEEYEAYKRMKEQERAFYYRYSNAKGTPIEEYLMDDRTKLITYYDRMPPKYQKQLLDRADTLYRRYESEKYLNNSNQNTKQK